MATLILQVKITTSNETKIVGWHEHYLKIKLAAQREKGRANQVLIAYLSDFFDVAKSEILILSGVISTLKKIAIEGIEELRLTPKAKEVYKTAKLFSSK